MWLCFWRVARPSHLERLWADGVDDALTAVQHPLPWAVGSQSNSRDSQLTHYSPSFVPRRLNLLCDARLCLKVPYYTFFFIKSKFLKTILISRNSRLGSVFPASCCNGCLAGHYKCLEEDENRGWLEASTTTEWYQWGTSAICDIITKEVKDGIFTF